MNLSRHAYPINKDGKTIVILGAGDNHIILVEATQKVRLDKLLTSFIYWNDCVEKAAADSTNSHDETACEGALTCAREIFKELGLVPDVSLSLEPKPDEQTRAQRQVPQRK